MFTPTWQLSAKGKSSLVTKLSLLPGYFDADDDSNDDEEDDDDDGDDDSGEYDYGDDYDNDDDSKFVPGHQYWVLC